MKTVLTKEHLEYLLECQDKLDQTVQNKFNITREQWLFQMQDQRDIALSVELNEFTNEFYDKWKWWKSQEVDYDLILEESVDVLHFMCSQLIVNYRKLVDVNYSDFNTIADTVYQYMLIYLEAWNFYSNYKVDSHFINEFIQTEPLTTDTLSKKLAHMMIILSTYGFTSEDVIRAYNEKNKVNFERMDGDY